LLSRIGQKATGNRQKAKGHRQQGNRQQATGKRANVILNII